MISFLNALCDYFQLHHEWQQRNRPALRSVCLVPEAGKHTERSSDVTAGGSVSLQDVFGDFDHKHHGVFGLVAEGFSDDVDGVLMGHALKRNCVHGHQLESSLRTRGGRSENKYLGYIFQSASFIKHANVDLLKLKRNWI